LFLAFYEDEFCISKSDLKREVECEKIWEEELLPLTCSLGREKRGGENLIKFRESEKNWR